MKVSVTKVIVLLCMVLSVAGFAEMYKWTDENGRVHFGDSPKETDKAEPVTVQFNSYEYVTYEDIEFYQAPVAAKSATVTMFSTAWCGYCKQARNYFRSKGIAFQEYDIETNDSARKKYDEIGGRGVPVIIIGKKRMNGFTVAGFENLYHSK